MNERNQSNDLHSLSHIQSGIVNIMSYLRQNIEDQAVFYDSKRIEIGKYSENGVNGKE